MYVFASGSSGPTNFSILVVLFSLAKVVQSTEYNKFAVKIFVCFPFFVFQPNLRLSPLRCRRRPCLMLPYLLYRRHHSTHCSPPRRSRVACVFVSVIFENDKSSSAQLCRCDSILFAIKNIPKQHLVTIYLSEVFVFEVFVLFVFLLQTPKANRNLKNMQSCKENIVK